jgi:flagellar assembly protein FliH
MISLSENDARRIASRGAGREMPVRLLGEAVGGVSRLEFYSLDRPEIATKPAREENSAVLLEEKLATLDGELRLQAEQMSAEIELGRNEARAEARREWEMEMAERIAEERAAIVRTCDEFRGERARYFAGVETEVVKLALAIASRVLHREAKLDPLLLTGVVRVALEKVAEDGATALRVPVGLVEMWKEVFANDLGDSLRVIGDERLGAMECVLETKVGRVELGVSAQLEEIERGFFDLMQQRPA